MTLTRKIKLMVVQPRHKLSQSFILPSLAAMSLLLLAWASIDPFSDPPSKAPITANETDPVMLDLDPYLFKAFGGGEDLKLAPLGTEAGLAQILQDQEFQQLVKKHDLQLFNGPLVGHQRPSGAAIWLRTAGPATVRAVVDGNPSKAVVTNAENDFTAVLQVDGLKAESEYSYSIEIDGRSINKPTFRLLTTPAPKTKTSFEILFGSGAEYIPKHEPIWTTMRERKPLAYLGLGDNLYIDRPDRNDLQRVYYYRRYLSGQFSSFVSSVGQYGIYDDHDLGTNDSAGGLDPFKPEWKVKAWKVFTENWANPSFGGGEKNPGCWFKTTFGDVDVFMLDGRYYRDNNNFSSLLGPVQLEWLLTELKQSTATFKVLASGTLWTPKADKKGIDSWEGFASERDKIYDLIAKHRINGVLLIAGDRHRTEIWKNTHATVPYPLWEFVSAKVTNIHTHGVRKEAEWSYNTGNFFGSLTFDFKTTNPSVTFRAIDASGKDIKEKTILLSELSFP
jgi:alkaline phosphatase D